MDRGVKQLISQALESKSKAFQTRIEGVVQNYIYMQKHPQNQDKQNRKRKTGHDKEENKQSVSEVICDISQLIPVPSTTGIFKVTNKWVVNSFSCKKHFKIDNKQGSFRKCKKLYAIA